MPRTNKPTDVFKYIDMLNGPDWIDPETGEVSKCWPFTGALNSKGRPYIQIDGKKHLAYRVVYDLTHDEPLGDRLLRHRCDNEICCRPEHGIPGDHQENMNDMTERERHGISHHAVRQIKALIKQGFSNERIAELTGMSRTTVYDIRVGRTHKNVKDEEDDRT